MNSRCNILKSYISLLNCEEVIDELMRLRSCGLGGYVCVSNVHTVVTGLKNHALLQATNNSLLSTADGVPLVWASRLIAPRIHGRASGPDIMAGLFEKDTNRRYSHAFYGSTKEVLEMLKKAIEKKWPGTKILCTISPEFGTEINTIRQDHLEELRRTNPDFLWVGLGAPKQELWMAAHHKKLPSTIMLGVGAAFDFISGNKPRAPLWMQKSGLEWFYRLLTEPKRLFWRYATTNFRFIFFVLIQILGGIFFPKRFNS